jgi:uncharacterized protein YgbK (DUF1537 family)
MHRAKGNQSTSMLLGCIADDFTGATDVALMLQRGGLETIQTIGVPSSSDLPASDAVVIALKSRTIQSSIAVRQALSAADFLLNSGAQQLIFKYCSTFDSTDAGNIGPVTEALMNRLNAPITIVCPAFPTNKRTVFQGHLFVGTQLLSESPMKDHPLTPMRDANLVRVLERQTSFKVGLIPHDIVTEGPTAIADEINNAARNGIRMAVIDCINDADLRAIGASCANLPLITGASGIAFGLSVNLAKNKIVTGVRGAPRFSATSGRAAILAGSCSTTTRMQVQTAIDAGFPAYRLCPLELEACEQRVSEVVNWAEAQEHDHPVLIYSSSNPDEIREVQRRIGRHRSAEIIEKTFSCIAEQLLQRGFDRLIVAGGETSGAVIEKIGVRTLAIGPEIDPGVPWVLSLNKPKLCIALKSGNFGNSNFFLKAWEKL